MSAGAFANLNSSRSQLAQDEFTSNHTLVVGPVMNRVSGSDPDTPARASPSGGTAATGLRLARDDRRARRPRRGCGRGRNGCLALRCSRSCGDYLLDAHLPGADAVGAAEDRRGRHRRRIGERAAEAVVLIGGAAAAHHLVDPPGIGRGRLAAERAAERHHRAHAVRLDFASCRAYTPPENPADDAHFCGRSFRSTPRSSVSMPSCMPGRGPEIASEVPSRPRRNPAA